MKAIGHQFLLKYIMSGIISEHGNLEIDDYNKLESVIDGFITNQNNIDYYKQMCASIIHSEEPIIEIFHILQTIQHNNSNIPNSYSPELSMNGERKKSKMWTLEEDRRLIAAIYLYGDENWNQISNFVGNNRKRSQCSQRWNRGLHPNISKKQWSPNEDAQLLSLVEQNGDKAWAKISSHMGNRSDVQCRYRYVQLKKNKSAPQSAHMSPNSSEDQIKLDSIIHQPNISVSSSLNNIRKAGDMEFVVPFAPIFPRKFHSPTDKSKMDLNSRPSSLKVFFSSVSIN